jgi:hypothetical protein
MRTLIVSDLHLGSLSGADLLRRPELRASLLSAIEDVDRLVLLGDVLELRHGPVREALSAAQPFFEDLGRALGERELVILAGNHDHALVEPWLARRGAEEDPAPLGLEQLLEPREASVAYERIARWASPAQVQIAYPGLWVRPDVYATHGHYLDCHLTVPTLERLSVGAMSRLLGRPASGFHSVADYEAMGAPVFAWRDAVARDTHTGNALNGLATVSAWSALRGGPRRPPESAGASESVIPASAAAPNGRAQRRPGRPALRELRRRALVAAFPLAVAALNRAGLGPLRAEISTEELRSAGLRAMDEVAARLGLGDAHVVFGHTHRAGPLPADEAGEWRGRDGARLINTGSWTYAGIFLTDTPGESPYWPGSAVLVEDTGPPRVLRLLQERSRAEIRPPRVATAG